MSRTHLVWLSTGSTLMAIILHFLFANSGCSPAIYPSSVVQMGVKSFGWENKMAQPSPTHSWKLMVPCELSALKLGASSLMRNDIIYLLISGKQPLPGCSVGWSAWKTHRKIEAGCIKRVALPFI